MGAELALKAALAGDGASDSDLRKYSHDLRRLVKDVSNAYSKFESASVEARVRRLPELVANRYSAQQPSRVETGVIVMDCQHIAGAVARALTNGSLRAMLRNN